MNKDKIKANGEHVTASAANECERITGAEAMMRSLEHEGVDVLFGYPGGAIMPTYDALYDHKETLHHILVRHEQGAVHAAQGYARVSGRVGCAIVTSGPGAMNTITGVADAMMDSTPMVVICGQVGAAMLGTDAFQEVDVIGVTQPITKWAFQIRKAEDIAWAVSRAFYIARSGRPGPVVLDFAKNAQTGMVDYKPAHVDFIRSYKPVHVPSEATIEEAARLINNSVKPFALVGQGVELGEAREELKALLEKAQIPAGCTMLGLSALPTDHPLNMGMLGMHGNLGPNVMTNQCDLLIAIGMRFDDRVTGKLETYAKQARIIHFDIDPSEINKNVKVDVAVVGNCKQTLQRVTELVEPARHQAWVDGFKPYEDKEDYKVIQPAIHPTEGPLLMGEVVRAVSEATAHKAILVTDVGQNQMFGCRYFQFSEARSVVTSAGCGTMGFGLPAAMGAQVAYCTSGSKRRVVHVAGDGGIKMTGNEYYTIARLNLPIISIIVNNSSLGMIRQLQKVNYNERFIACELDYPMDYAAYAKSFGIEADSVSTCEEFAEAFAKAMSKEAPHVIVMNIHRSFVEPMIKGNARINEFVEFK